MIDSEISKPVTYGNFTYGFVDSLAQHIGKRRVLEVFAGNGFLASSLSHAGVQILATTLLSGHDGHEHGLYFPIVEMDALEAVGTLGKDSDLLLMSWPTTTDRALQAALEWAEQADRPILYIGEMPQADMEFGGYPGCASDSFFAVTRVVCDLPDYVPRNMLDRAVELRVKPEYI